MSKPTILLVPGACALPEFYDNVVEGVTAKGYEMRALQTRCVAPKTGIPEGPAPTMYDDAALIAKTVEDLADQGKDVILIAHSYGGVPATESTKGLAKTEREKEGKKGGITRLAYKTALVPPVGKASADLLGTVPDDQKLNMSIDEKGWVHHVDYAQSAAICFNELSPEEGEAWVHKFQPHSAASFGSPLTYPGYKYIPVSYLVCEKDRCIPASLQRSLIKMIEEESGKVVDVTSIDGDHCPSVKDPKPVIDWVLDVAGNA